jgi:hypothetical protein
MYVKIAQLKESMPTLTEVVERIARCAEQQNFLNCVEAAKAEATRLHQPYAPPIDELPRLSLQQITEITQDYPFRLPTEVLELYQIGNGCFPIGLDPCKDWNSLENYFIFPDPYFARLLPLGEAMDRYRYDNKPLAPGYPSKVDPNLFPLIDGFERRHWAVMGSESQCYSAPIVFYFVDYPKHIRPVWLSLTNLLLAWVEVKEQQLTEEDGDRFLEIAREHEGVTGDACEGAELLWYLSFRVY